MTEVKKRILEAAGKLFGRFGLKKTSVEEITRAARIGKGTLYKYFASKEEVFRGVAERELSTLWEATRKAIETVEDPGEKIRTFVLTRMRLLKKLGSAYAAIHDEYLQQLGFIEQIREQVVEREVETIREILKEGVARGVFKITDVALTAYAMVVAMKGLEYPWMVQTAEEKLEENLDALLGVLFKGIQTR